MQTIAFNKTQTWILLVSLVVPALWGCGARSEATGEADGSSSSDAATEAPSTRDASVPSPDAGPGADADSPPTDGMVDGPECDVRTHLLTSQTTAVRSPSVAFRPGGPGVAVFAVGGEDRVVSLELNSDGSPTTGVVNVGIRGLGGSVIAPSPPRTGFVVFFRGLDDNMGEFELDDQGSFLRLQPWSYDLGDSLPVATPASLALLLADPEAVIVIPGALAGHGDVSWRVDAFSPSLGAPLPETGLVPFGYAADQRTGVLELMTFEAETVEMTTFPFRGSEPLSLVRVTDSPRPFIAMAGGETLHLEHAEAVTTFRAEGAIQDLVSVHVPSGDHVLTAVSVQSAEAVGRIELAPRSDSSALQEVFSEPVDEPIQLAIARSQDDARAVLVWTRNFGDLHQVWAASLDCYR